MSTEDSVHAMTDPTLLEGFLAAHAGRTAESQKQQIADYIYVLSEMIHRSENPLLQLEAALQSLRATCCKTLVNRDDGQLEGALDGIRTVLDIYSYPPASLDDLPFRGSVLVIVLSEILGRLSTRLRKMLMAELQSQTLYWLGRLSVKKYQEVGFSPIVKHEDMIDEDLELVAAKLNRLFASSKIMATVEVEFGSFHQVLQATVSSGIEHNRKRIILWLAEEAVNGDWKPALSSDAGDAGDISSL